MNNQITEIIWTDNSVNRFRRNDPTIKDFIAYKKKKNPKLRIKLKYNTTEEASK